MVRLCREPHPLVEGFHRLDRHSRIGSYDRARRPRSHQPGARNRVEAKLGLFGDVLRHGEGTLSDNRTVDGPYAAWVRGRLWNTVQQGILGNLGIFDRPTRRALLAAVSIRCSISGRREGIEKPCPLIKHFVGDSRWAIGKKLLLHSLCKFYFPAWFRQFDLVFRCPGFDL